jgi:hypothetical protein
MSVLVLYRYAHRVTCLILLAALTPIPAAAEEISGKFYRHEIVGENNLKMGLAYYQ